MSCTSLVSLAPTPGPVCRPSVNVPTKMHSVTARTAQWPRKAPEQPATAIGAMATRHQGVSFIRDGSPRVDVLIRSKLHVSDVTTSASGEPNFYRCATEDGKRNR